VSIQQGTPDGYVFRSRTNCQSPARSRGSPYRRSAGAGLVAPRRRIQTDATSPRPRRADRPGSAPSSVTLHVIYERLCQRPMSHLGATPRRGPSIGPGRGRSRHVRGSPRRGGSGTCRWRGIRRCPSDHLATRGAAGTGRRDGGRADRSEAAGVGVRALVGSSWGFAATSDLEAAETAWSRAAAIAQTRHWCRAPTSISPRSPWCRSVCHPGGGGPVSCFAVDP
jgi:hypothetical protein